MDYITADEKKVLMDKLDRWSIVMHSKVDGQRFVIEALDYNNLLVGIRRLLPNDKFDIRIRWVDPEINKDEYERRRQLANDLLKVKGELND